MRMRNPLAALVVLAAVCGSVAVPGVVLGTELEQMDQAAREAAEEAVDRLGQAPTIEGVDAILFGTVREWSSSVWSTRALCRLSLHLANVETGEIVWSSGEVRGEAYPAWPDLIKRFWRYPLFVLVGLLALIILLVIIVRVRRAFRRAMRPR